MAIALTTAPLRTRVGPGKRAEIIGSDTHAPPSRLVVFCPDQVQHVYERGATVWVACEIIGGFGGLEGEDGGDGVEWGLVEEEYGPVLEMSLCAIGEHQIGEKTSGEDQW